MVEKKPRLLHFSIPQICSPLPPNPISQARNKCPCLIWDPPPLQTPIPLTLPFFGVALLWFCVVEDIFSSPVGKLVPTQQSHQFIRTECVEFLHRENSIKALFNRHTTMINYKGFLLTGQMIIKTKR